jgi:hypothetical protein
VAAAACATVALLAASVVIGAAVWRLAGLAAPSHVAPVVGFAVLLVVVQPAVMWLPGREWTGLALAVVLVVASLASRAVRADVRAGLGEGIPVMLGALVVLFLPFLVSGHFGILGMGNNDDLAQHLPVVRWTGRRTHRFARGPALGRPRRQRRSESARRPLRAAGCAAVLHDLRHVGPGHAARYARP